MRFFLMLFIYKIKRKINADHNEIENINCKYKVYVMTDDFSRDAADVAQNYCGNKENAFAFC